MCCEPGVPAAAPADAQRAAAFCGAELGRWITPFMRGIGRWLTDVTPLFPLLTGQRCSFNLYTDSWAMPWVDSLALRFRNLNGSSSSASAADVAQPEAQQQRQDDATGQGRWGGGDRPLDLMPLYAGTQNFDKSVRASQQSTVTRAPALLTAWYACCPAPLSLWSWSVTVACRAVQHELTRFSTPSSRATAVTTTTAASSA